MAYLTEARLDSVMDIPLSLPSTTLQQGDWLVVGSVQILSPMTLTYKFANLDLLDSTVDTTQIQAVNQIFGNLGLVYLSLWLNYSPGSSPGAAGALDVLIAPALGSFQRDVTKLVTLTTPGIYSWIVANNCQPSSDPSSLLSASLSIDYTVIITGQVRLDLGA